MVNTKAVTDRRSLRFNSTADYRLDIDRLEAAHKAGTLRASGNWTPGQAFAHLAAFIDFAYDGYPPELRPPPRLFRFIFGLAKKKYFHGRLPVGIRIPGVKNGTVGADLVAINEGLTRLKRALSRLESSAPTVPNPVFGRLSHEDWTALHLRHAELHLSFLHPA